MIKTDYNKIAKTYDNRYSANYLVHIEDEIKNHILQSNYTTVLEAGCGTGKWIKSLKHLNKNIFGLDYSFDMLKIPKIDTPELDLVNGNAVEIPFKDNFFDFIFCVNAIHHFPDKVKFIRECKRILSGNGVIGIFGVDPHIDKDWYVYQYFDSVYKNDLIRFPSLENLKLLLQQEQFYEIDVKPVEEIYDDRIGGDVFNDPFLQKNHCSQLANLSDEDYEKGIEKIKVEIEQNPKAIFRTSVIFYLISAKKN